MALRPIKVGDTWVVEDGGRREEFPTQLAAWVCCRAWEVERAKGQVEVEAEAAQARVRFLSDLIRIRRARSLVLGDALCGGVKWNIVDLRVEAAYVTGQLADAERGLTQAKKVAARKVAKAKAMGVIMPAEIDAEVEAALADLDAADDGEKAPVFRSAPFPWEVTSRAVKEKEKELDAEDKRVKAPVFRKALKAPHMDFPQEVAAPARNPVAEARERLMQDLGGLWAAQGALNDWERRFVDDMRRKAAVPGFRASVKQLEKVEKLLSVVQAQTAYAERRYDAAWETAIRKTEAKRAGKRRAPAVADEFRGDAGARRLRLED